ncbi:hypothetical protein V1387_18400 [Allomuricauda taeanensis]|uniref:hypothetical protein n=1 Tax=Flagellimonas taeanensis TaxID=1005926 RepID=UPI002E7B306A|nr:hypothetical protein [Allomuricauda taeanensis]MEE1964656.1 hypothetical protein [Allomuricauda taeanensis]
MERDARNRVQIHTTRKTDRYATREIANRLERSESYIRQRIKLAGLIEGFKVFIGNGEMTLGLGVTVPLFEPGSNS